LLTNRIVGSKHVRGLEVIKMRAAGSIGGIHEFSISEAGVAVFPRLEALAGTSRRPQAAEHGMGTGIAGLDAMLGGGLMPYSSTLVMGTPGVGKTILGLHFLVEGADRGERGLLAGFHETAHDLILTAEGIGLDLRRHIESGLIRVLWNAPLELSADDWARQVLQSVEDHAPSRVYIDALTDVQRIITDSGRMPLFVTAFVHELRNRGITVLIAAELDDYTTDTLAVPIPAASAAMDNCILLRHVEIRGAWRRVVAVPKARRSNADPVIRDVQITDQGMTIAHPVLSAVGLLTGRATPILESNGGNSL
jgi:circadian clock protein KaiC